MEKDNTQSLLESILKALASKPDEVDVTKTVDEMGVLFLVKLGEGDAGLIIGRAGRTIQAIRLIMTAIGMKNKARLNVKLDVPERLASTPQIGDGEGRRSKRFNFEDQNY